MQPCETPRNAQKHRCTPPASFSELTTHTPTHTHTNAHPCVATWPHPLLLPSPAQQTALWRHHTRHCEPTTATARWEAKTAPVAMLQSTATTATVTTTTTNLRVLLLTSRAHEHGLRGCQSHAACPTTGAFGSCITREAELEAQRL